MKEELPGDRETTVFDSSFIPVALVTIKELNRG
jgi:hypothetical protein